MEIRVFDRETFLADMKDSVVLKTIIDSPADWTKEADGMIVKPTADNTLYSLELKGFTTEVHKDWTKIVRLN